MIILFRCILLAFLWVFSFSLTADTLTQKTFTLNQLSKVDTAVLQGHRPSYTIYIPVPSQWDIQKIDLNLSVQFSTLLLNSSTLTVMVDDLPVDSIKLDKSATQPILWHVSIPKSLIHKKMITVRIIGYMKISEDVCSDVENQANWVTLAGNSSVTYHFLHILQDFKLFNFPYPFINEDLPFADKVAFLMPNNMVANDFAPYFKLANILGKRANWRGIEFETYTTDSFNDLSLSSPAIIVGTPDRVHFPSIKFSNGLHLENNKWMQNDTPLNDDSGFIGIYTQNQQPILVISANTSSGLTTAIESINSSSINYRANNPSVFIASPGNTASQSLNESKNKPYITFKDLGYDDNTVFGSGQSQLSYQFNLPVQFSNNPVKLLLNYSYSPFLQQNKASTLTVNLNGHPIDGVSLKLGSSQKTTFEVLLPPEFLEPGNNSLNITFNMILPEENCTRDYLNEAWGIIYNNSYLEFQKSQPPAPNKISSYPELMNGLVFVGLPDSHSIYNNKPLLQELLQFATTLTHTRAIYAMNNESLPEEASQHNVIYLSTGNNNSKFLAPFKQSMSQLVDNLSLTSNNTLKAIDKSIFINASKERQDVGFVNINSTGFGNQFALLNIFGYTEDELKLALNMLNDAYKRKSLVGTLAVSFQNGSYTSLSPQDIKDNVSTEISMEKANWLTLKVVGYGFIVLLIIGLIFIIQRAWKNKRS